MNANAGGSYWNARARALWTLAVVTFGVGDVVSTLWFLGAGNPEGNPLAAAAIASFGLWSLIPLKAAVFAVFGGMYRVAPRAWAVGVPLGLTVLGALITTWNVYSSLMGVTLGM